MSTRRPALSGNVWGTHVIPTPAGTYAFTGAVPKGLHGTSYATERDAEDALLSWIAALPHDERRDLTSRLRADLFARALR